MIHHWPRALAALAFSLLLTGCPESGTGVAGRLESRRPGAPERSDSTARVPGPADQPGPATGATGQPDAELPGDTAPAASSSSSSWPRSLVDRPDDSSDFQFHFIYVHSPDAPDLRRDTSGAIARSIGVVNAWFATETDGRRINVDTYQGRPDISYYALKSVPVMAEGDELSKAKAVVAQLRRELPAAGFRHPRKYYAVYFDGPFVPSVSGLGGNGLALTFLGKTGLGAGDSPIQTPAFAEYTMAHEILHTLGAVPDGGPNADLDHHVNGPADDVMYKGENRAAERHLDVGRDDYYGHGLKDRLDVARSLFWHPLASDAAPPEDRVMALDAGLNPVPYPSPRHPAASFAGEPAMEAAILQRLQAERLEAGLPALPVEPALTTAARQNAQASLVGAPPAIVDWALDYGYFGPAGVWRLQATRPTTESLEATAEDLAKRLLTDVFRERLKTTYTGLGVGVKRQDNRWSVTIAIGLARFEVKDVTLGEGPLGTYTLSGRGRMRPGQPARFYTTGVTKRFSMRLPIPEDAPDGWFTFRSDVPRRGIHAASVYTSTEETGSMSGWGTSLFLIDGDKPAAEAFVSQSLADRAETTWALPDLDEEAR